MSNKNRKIKCLEILGLQKALSQLDRAVCGTDDEDVNQGLRAVKMAYKEYKRAVKKCDFTYS